MRYLLVLFTLMMSSLGAQEFVQVVDKHHLSAEKGVWIYEFDVFIQAERDGTIAPVIRDLERRHREAWVSLLIRAQTVQIEKTDLALLVTVKVTSRGQARHWRAPVGTVEDQSTWSWGEPQGAEHAKEWEIPFVLPFEAFPELRDLGVVRGGSAEVLIDEAAGKPGAPRLVLSPARYRGLSGDTVLIRQGENLPVKGEIPLYFGDQLKTGDATGELYLSDSLAVRIETHSSVVVPLDPENTVSEVSIIRLRKGTLVVQAGGDHGPFKIATPEAVATVIEGTFTLQSADGSSRVGVSSGEVYLSNPVGEEGRVIEQSRWAVMPPVPTKEGGLNLTGRWDTSFGPAEITHTNEVVSGTYAWDHGKFEGTLKGLTLRGRWSEDPSHQPPSDAGIFEWTFSEDGTSFEGNWRYGFEAGDWRGAWNGTKLNEPEE